MPSLRIAQALLSPETQEALSLPTTALILRALSEVETIMEIVDRVCDPLFRSAVEAARTTDPHTSVIKAASSHYEFRTI
jgi:hypothetical protein